MLVAGGSAWGLEYTPPPALSTAELYGDTNKLVSISVSPADTVVAYRPTGYPLTTWTAIGTFDDGSTQPFTALLYWTCSNPNIGYMDLTGDSFKPDQVTRPELASSLAH